MTRSKRTALAGVAFLAGVAAVLIATRKSSPYAAELGKVDAFCEATASRMRDLAARLGQPTTWEAAFFEYQHSDLLAPALALCTRSVANATALYWCGIGSDHECTMREAGWLAVLSDLRRVFR